MEKLKAYAAKRLLSVSLLGQGEPYRHGISTMRAVRKDHLH